MAVFRAGRTFSAWLQPTSRARLYNPALPLDYYHTKLVAAVAAGLSMPAAAKVDTAIGSGSWQATCSASAMSKGGNQLLPKREAVITAKSGGTVNFRQLPRDGAALVSSSPGCLGTEVNVLERAGLWSRSLHNGIRDTSKANS